MKKVILPLIVLCGLLSIGQVRADIAPKSDDWEPCTVDYECASSWCGCNGGSTMQCLPNSSYPKYCSNSNILSHEVYRFWSPVFKSHFYTIDETEYWQIKNNDKNWQYEGVAFKAFTSQRTSTVPVYRFWSPIFGKHFYTANSEEFNRLKTTDPNWVYEKIAFYAYPRDYSGAARDIYRFWSPAFSNSHFYTADENEYNRVKSDPNWSLEDIGFRTPNN